MPSPDTARGNRGWSHGQAGAIPDNMVEQDHRAIKRRVRASQGFRAFHSACRTLQGIETMNTIREGQVRGLAKDDIAGQVALIDHLFSLKAA